MEHKCIPEIPIEIYLLPNHLKCIICGNILTKAVMICKICRKTILEYIYCEKCGFNKPDMIKSLEKMK